VSVFHWPVRVYYEDTDSGGVVYYANYLKFMERARTEWLRSLGFEQDRLRDEQGVIFAVRSATIDYLKPALFNDVLDVAATIVERGRASFSVEHAIHRDETLLCQGLVKVACLKANTLRPCPIPESILMEMQDER